MATQAGVLARSSSGIAEAGTEAARAARMIENFMAGLIDNTGGLVFARVMTQRSRERKARCFDRNV